MLHDNRYYGIHPTPAIPSIVMKIIRRLSRAGFEAFVVGGAVRDIYLNRPIVDWDIATSASKDGILCVFKDQKKFCIKHGTITLIDKNRHYEITSYRGGHDSTIREDLGHRDFTINAMAYDIADNSIIDPFNGIEDIKKKIIKAVGDACGRFDEDPLRLLRAVRISTELGFNIEKGTMEAISRMSERLSSQSPERIRDEFMKILLSRRPSNGFGVLRRSGLLKQFLPELIEGYRKKQNNYHCYTIFRHILETIDNIKPEPTLRLTALFHDIAKSRVRKKINGIYHFYGHEAAGAELTKTIMRRLKYSNAMIRKVSHLVSNHVIGYNSQWSDGGVRRFVRRVGPDNVDDLLLLRKADLVTHRHKDREMELLDEFEKRIKKVKEDGITKGKGGLAINGNMIMEALNIEEGAEIGRILKILLEKVTDRPELNTEQQLLKIVKQIKRGGKVDV